MPAVTASPEIKESTTTDRIVVDLGNSAATIALIRGDRTLASMHSLLHGRADFEAKLTTILDAMPAAPLGVASVSPKALDRFIEALRGSRRVLIAPHDFAPSIENACEQPQMVGLDRLFNAEALARDAVAVIIDAGTAITVDLVVCGVFCGGAIAPGIRMSYSALHNRTGQLPLVSASPVPPHVLGKNTVAALRSGVEIGTAGMIDRLVHDLSRSYDAVTILTGGDARLLLPLLRCMPRHDETLTLRGIDAALCRALVRS